MKNKQVKKMVCRIYKLNPNYNKRGDKGIAVRNAVSYLENYLGIIWYEMDVVSIKGIDHEKTTHSN